MKTRTVGMLLAGGEGKRLGLLTKNLAKPAVPFGGKYRIIDFTLSNCTNSGINTVGVLTQYSPMILNKHIGIGKPWDLDRQVGGVSILSPFTAKEGGSWYKGTADAISQNLHFIDQYDPEYVLVISGDHIYQMNYQKLIQHHEEKNSDVTISVIEVPWKEASRFGILNTKENLEIYEFDEKPENPKSNLASMGIYIFNWKTLKKYLIEDSSLKDSTHDFGKDIIPAMLENGLKMFAYRFEGYWKDVGTTQSYWEANMDLLEEDLSLSLNSKEWRTYSHDSNYPPQFVDKEALIKNSLINSGSWISGNVSDSVLFEGITVEKGSSVNQSILHPKVHVGKNCTIDRAIIMEDVHIPDGTSIDGTKFEEPVVINDSNLHEFISADKEMNG